MAQSGGHRFIDDLDFLQAGGVPRLNRGVSLSITKLSRYGDHRFFDFTDLRLSGRQQFAQYLTGDVFGSPRCASDLPEAGILTDKAFRILDDSIRSSDCVAQCFGTHDNGIVVKENNRGSRQFAFLVCDRDRLPVFVEPRDTRVRCTKVNSNGLRFCHHAHFRWTSITGQLMLQRRPIHNYEKPT